MDTDKVIEEAVKDGIRKGIQDKMNASYDNPWKERVGRVVRNEEQAP